MNRTTERQANESLEQQAAERARWAAFFAPKKG